VIRVALKELPTNMLSRLKRRWNDLRNGQPGYRFRAQFERCLPARAGKSFLRRWFAIFVGVVLLIVGIILCFMPGPGLPFVILGASVLAEQFHVVARTLDSLEIKLREMTRRGTAWWRQTA
jgi:hypothetical protein